MGKTKQDDTSPQTVQELTSPLSPKRPRTDWTNSCSETFCKTICCPSSVSTLQMIAGLLCTDKCGVIEDEKPHCSTTMIVSSITNLSASHAHDAPTSSPVGCPLLLVTDEQPLVIECDKFCHYLRDDAGGELAESHTSRDSTTDTSSHPDCKLLRESLEDGPPGGCNLPLRNGRNGRQALSSVSQIQALDCSSSDEEAGCQSHSCGGKMLNGTGFCNTWRQSAEYKETTQERDGHGFREIILAGEKKGVENSSVFYSDYADKNLFYPNVEEVPSGNLAEGVKNEGEKLELQICRNGDVAVCETKGQANDNGLSRNTIHCAAECAEGSIVSYDVVSARNMTTENVHFEADVPRGAEGEHAAGKMIAEAGRKTADHPAETPMPARISQEHAEGDNDVGSFSVIDPAIWRETDREAGETCCYSESNAGGELFPSAKFCEMETLPASCSDIRPSQEVPVPKLTRLWNRQSRTQQCKDEKDKLCQSHTAPQGCSISTTRKPNKTVEEGICCWKSSPCSSLEFLPAEDEGRESLWDCETVGHCFKEQEQSGSFPVSPKDQEMWEDEPLQVEIVSTDGEPEIDIIEELSSDEHGKSQNICDWTTGKLNRYGNKPRHIKESNKTAWLSDHVYSAVCPTTEGITESRDESSAGKETEANSEMSVMPEDVHQPQSPQRRTEASPDDCAGKWTKGRMSNSVSKLSPVSQPKQGNELICFSDYDLKAETFTVENKDDLLATASQATSDAVVPGELTPSQNSSDKPAALHCTDRLSPLPSAFTFYDRKPAGFDTFERIQLLVDDNDGNESDYNSVLLTSAVGQLLEIPEHQHYNSVPDAANKHKVIPEAEEEKEGDKEVEELECHAKNMAHDFFRSDYTCSEVPDLIEAAAAAAAITALRRPQQQPDGESAGSSSASFSSSVNVQNDLEPQATQHSCPASELNDIPKFEMKRQFDVVLKELNLYFDISMSDFTNDCKESSPEQWRDASKAVEDKTSSCKDELSSPELEHQRDTLPGK